MGRSKNIFNDSLPDGWGRLLLDRTLAERNIPLSTITPLDRLSYVGQNGMGALIYRPAISSDYDRDKLLELDTIATASQHILAGSSSDIIDELFSLGGSSGGARPKIIVGYDSLSNHIIHGNFSKEEKEDYEHWIIKFPSSGDPADIAQIEYAYYLMARQAGIDMSESQLFESRSGRLYFGTKRFDRDKNRRMHIHSAAGLMHDNFRLSSMDYGHLMDAAFRLENNINACSKILRLAAFNVFAHNRDDHSKNVSFLMNAKGEWKVAPAYDLTFSNSSHGFHSTTVAGEGRSPGRKHLLELADVFGVSGIPEIIDQVRGTINNWKVYAQESGVGKASARRIAKTLDML